ncbi:hypothetical protein SPB21_17865 [Leptothoe sp. ISB3NOV94-8A]|uniref:Uncharacterized protein n=1 Tax=Adonisia turfae CCMR0081 TaxID=2292702 RepID=A0A6M0RPV5_9CYAN|nr:hypothetical protein [Adonisia turfae]MDV3349379.1 hypothetical protein [Leptothoe sp. LEGE 181152]NEZ58288.1 hypothetical protein [Adonisia turfae CCMR0081]
MTSKSFKSQQIRRFKFWRNQRLRDGMQYQYALFQRIHTADYKQRHQVYQQASQLAQQGADILVTYEDQACHLWLNLKHKA